MDGKRCDAELIKREDIATLYQNENYTQSGFCVNIPRESFSTCSQILLKGVDEYGKEHILYEWNEKS